MKTRFLNWGFVVAGALSLGSLASARNPMPSAQDPRRLQEVETLLKQFETDPKRFLNELPPKFDPNTGAPVTVLRRKPSLDSPVFQQMREEIMSQAPVDILSAPEIRASAQGIALNFAGPELRDAQTDLRQMESSRLMESELKGSPWSDSYWPLYRGAAAARYADSGFDSVSPAEWSSYNKYVNTYGYIFPYFIRGASSDSPLVLNLSPAEKYDLLVGDDEAHLSKDNWEQGGVYARRNGGHVERWMGLCHGWAPASYMEDRPEDTIRVWSADKKYLVTFFPSDIKALATLLWAKAGASTRFVGTRCNTSDPRRDINGRIVSPECFDTDPGVWHLAVVNRIGRVKKSFVIDNTYDYEVWNQPVYGYKYSYFNPQTKRNTRSLEEARAPARFAGDIFSSYRSPNAAYIVGVAMDVVYSSETRPSHSKHDSDDDDYLVGVRYLYDLELDANGRILGGEWYSNAHPDFLWTPYENAYPGNGWDRNLTDEWKRGEPLPKSWVNAAAVSRGSGYPLARIVKQLIKFAR